MASSNMDAFGRGLFSGFTASLDANSGPVSVADAATTAGSQDNSGEGKDYITGPNSGVRYGQVDNSRFKQLEILLAHTGVGYLDSGDWGTAEQQGRKAVIDHDALAKRAAEAPQLDADGHDPHGINSYVASGKQSDLVTGDGQMIVTDPNTGKKIRVDAKTAMDMQKTQAELNSSTTKAEGNDMVTRDAQGKEISRQVGAAGAMTDAQKAQDQNQKAQIDLDNKKYWDERSDVQGTTDLGDRVRVQFKNGDTTFYTKGMTPAEMAKSAQQNKINFHDQTNLRNSGEGKALSQVVKKNTLYGQAQSDMEQYDAAIAAGDKVKARQIAVQAAMNVNRGESGGDATIHMDDGTIQDRQKISNFWNNTVLQLDGKLSSQEYHGYRSGIEAGIKSTNETTQKAKEQLIQNWTNIYSSSMTREEAREKAENLVNSVVGGEWTGSDRSNSGSSNSGSTSGTTKSGNKFTITGTN